MVWWLEGKGNDQYPGLRYRIGYSIPADLLKRKNGVEVFSVVPIRAEE
jgi:hypothetical protein